MPGQGVKWIGPRLSDQDRDALIEVAGVVLGRLTWLGDDYRMAILKERFIEKGVKKGDIGLMLSFGPGFTAQRLLLKW